MGLCNLRLNKQGFFYHCSLFNVSIERIAREGDHVLRGYLDFFFDEDTVRLKPDPDLEILDRGGIGLNPPLMDWFSAWMQNDAPPGTIIYKTEFAVSLRSLTDRTSALHALQCFYREHSYVRGYKGKTLLVPILDLHHWSLAVISNEGFYKFDSGSVMNPNFHGPQRLHEALAKMWCIVNDYRPGTNEWRTAASIGSWTHAHCPQQPDVWSCGFYVASYIGKLWSFLKETSVNSRDWVNGVSCTVL